MRSGKAAEQFGLQALQLLKVVGLAHGAGEAGLVLGGALDELDQVCGGEAFDVAIFGGLKFGHRWVVDLDELKIHASGRGVKKTSHLANWPQAVASFAHLAADVSLVPKRSATCFQVQPLARRRAAFFSFLRVTLQRMRAGMVKRARRQAPRKTVVVIS